MLVKIFAMFHGSIAFFSIHLKKIEPHSRHTLPNMMLIALTKKIRLLMNADLLTDPTLPHVLLRLVKEFCYE